MSEPAGRGAFRAEQRVPSASRRDSPLSGPGSRSSATGDDSGLRRPGDEQELRSPGDEQDTHSGEGGRQPLPRAVSRVRQSPSADRRRPRYLRLVADGGRLVSQPPGQPARVRREPVRSTAPGQPAAPFPAVPPSQAVAPRQPAAPHQAAPHQAAARRATARTPVRLTRRGRLAVTAAAVLIVGAVSMTLAGVAQATGHSATAAHGRAGVTKVLVGPGQNLWSLAEKYAPDADTRLVIQEILQLNSMSTDQVQPGQVLWVPRG